ncbi:four helix bundle protein [Bacteroidota bacterium]
MFDFEKLDVYQKIKQLNVRVYILLNGSKKIDPFIVDQLKRASMSVLLNLAEGTGRISIPDKKNFITIARGSLFESVAIFDFLKESAQISNEDYDSLYPDYETISKMLLGMYRSYDK